MEVLPKCGAANTVLQGAPFQSGQYSADYPASQAFDGLRGTLWISETWQAPAFLGLSSSEPPVTVTQYAVGYGNGPRLTTRAPNTWQLEGSLDGSDWTAVDWQAGETDWGRSQERVYSVAKPAPFSHYRLFLTLDNDSRSDIVVVSIGELTLFHSCDP